MSEGDGKSTIGFMARSSSTPGSVTQKFRRGRTNSVVVETKARRTLKSKPGAGAGAGAIAEQAKARPAIADPEIERRMKALEAARVREAEEKEREEERRREEEAKEHERLAKQRAEAESRRETESEAIEPEAAPAKPAESPDDDRRRTQSRPQSKQAGAKRREDDRDQKGAGRGRGGRSDGGRRSGKLTLNQALSGSDGDRQKSLAAMKRKQERARQKALGVGPQVRTKVVRDVQLPEFITVGELANRMAERVADVIKSLMNNGIMVTQNQTIDADTAELIIEEFGHRVTRVSDADVEDVIHTVDDAEADLLPRAPVVAIMGHVDHGKTSLLDAIRDAKVQAGEAGGITQHIGAYQVSTEGGAALTFLDTPGHAAFTSMRARGANVTDIVVLVVAADDSVMPQTVEAISHAKAAEAPMIVAINKCDRPEADPGKVRTELLKHDVIVEEMSGEVQDVEVSATSGQGLDSLLEAISLQAEIMELKANPNRPAEGAVIEAKLDVGRGPVATVLVRRGTLRSGDIFVVGEQYGKVRAMINARGERVDEAGPSVPVEVLGLNGTPEAGDVLNVVDTEVQAREISEYRGNVAKTKRSALGAAGGASLDQLMAQVRDQKDARELPIVVKSDVQGSAEAIVQAMEKIGNEEVSVRVLHSGVGAITETDVGLAEASQAPVLGFNVRANASARGSATRKGVEIRYYSVIYDLVDDVKLAASGLLSAEIRETFVGYAEIREVFKVSGVGKVAGCMVTEGSARRALAVRLLRDNVVVHEGTLKTLKRFKDEVAEVPSGQECGMAFENYDDIRQNDVIEIFQREEVERRLE